jgi:transposase
MGRLANPASKMATVNDLSEHFGISLSLPSVYRMMDLIDDKVIDNIQQKAYAATQGLFSEPIRVAFYDCTALYFESFTEEVKENGYSKDLKFNQPQILLAFLVTEGGLPLGYQVYEGSMYEGHTLKDAIERIEQKYRIKEITFVADSGMFSKENIQLLEGLQKHYIVGARLKNLPAVIQEQILDKQGYTTIKKGDNNEYSYKEIEYNQMRLIVTYNREKAIKNTTDREQAIERQMSKLKGSKSNPTWLMSNFGYKKFIKVEGTSTFAIDQEKIEKAERWDGIHGIFTNHRELSVEKVLEQYHGLWQVEESFRISKHDLRIRPIYHWTPERIKAHVAICFMAFTCARHLNYRIRLQKEPLSIEKTRQILTHVQLSILKDTHTGKQYGVPSLLTQEAKNIYHAVGLKITDVPFEIT